MSIDHFPLGLALGEAFCNRKEERHHLLSNIEHVKPTLITSPRRYGKTSLAIQTISNSKLPFTHIDFFADITQADVESNVLRGIGTVISKLLPAPQRALKAAQEFFSEMQVKLVIQGADVGIEFSREAEPAQQLKSLFIKLDQLASKYQQTVIIFIDEFQRLTQIENSQNLEAIFRQIAQQSKHIMFIFSGSNRHLLKQMFEDRNRPFYKLCDRIAIERIAVEHYHDYMQHAAKNQWQQMLSPTVIDLILLLTEQHPYYVNLLCSRLWLMDQPPTEINVSDCWQRLALEERSQVAAELDLLSNNQCKVLISLARLSKTSAPLSKEFTSQVQLSASSIAQSLAVLEERDYIYRDLKGYYFLIDPLMKKMLSY
jgi:hypothetical protein